MSDRELRHEVKLGRLIDMAIVEQEELKMNILSVLTHDKIADKMKGILDDDVEIDRYQLGVTVIAVRKLVLRVMEEGE